MNNLFHKKNDKLMLVGKWLLVIFISATMVLLLLAPLFSN